MITDNFVSRTHYQTIIIKGEDDEDTLDFMSDSESPSVQSHRSTGTSTIIRSKKQTSKSGTTTGSTGNGALPPPALKSSKAGRLPGAGLATGVGRGTSMVTASAVPRSPAVTERSVGTAGVGVGGTATKEEKGGGVLRLLGSSVTASLLCEEAGPESRTSVDRSKEGTPVGERKRKRRRKEHQEPLKAAATYATSDPVKPFEADWDSSEGEEMPFLDNLLVSAGHSPGAVSTSSWESSQNEEGEVMRETPVGVAGGGVAPNFLTDIGMDESLEEGFQGSGSEERGGFQFKEGTRDWLSDSEGSSD